MVMTIISLWLILENKSGSKFIFIKKPELELIKGVFIDVVKLEVHLGSKVNQVAQVSELVLCIS